MPPEIPSRSKKLLRQMNRHLGSDDAELHVAAIYSYLSGLPLGHAHTADARSLSKFPAFLDSIDKSYYDYEDKIKMVSRSLELSSQELNVSNRQLETLNAAINSMLDSLGQGLVFFDSQGMCSSVYSKSCESLLDTAPGNKKIQDVLHLKDSQLNSFYSWLDIIFGPQLALSFDDLADLAPDHYINASGQYVELDYRPVFNINHELQTILLIATDKSLEQKAAQSLKETQELSQTIVSISQNRNEFCSFVLNVRSLISGLVQKENGDPIEVLRELHTYKGLAYHFGLKRLGRALHAAEGYLQDAVNKGLSINYASLLEDVGHELLEANKLAEELLGHDFLDRGHVRTIEVAKIKYLRDCLKDIGDERSDALRSFLNENILGSSLKECFSVFATEITRIASLQGKPIPMIHYHSSVSSIITSDYGDFFEALIHLARNIMDHGIEAPSVRRKSHKVENGRIDIYAALKKSVSGSDILEIKIRDDGYGFDLNVLRPRLALLNIQAQPVESLSDHEVIQYIFHPGFSTQSSVSALSGRGVGMYAIYKSVEGLGGTCRASPALPGAEFLFELPVAL